MSAPPKDARLRAEVEAAAEMMIGAACQAVRDTIGPDFHFVVVIQPFDIPERGTLTGGTLPVAGMIALTERAAADLRRGALS